MINLQRLIKVLVVKKCFRSTDYRITLHLDFYLDSFTKNYFLLNLAGRMFHITLLAALLSKTITLIAFK